MKQTRNSINWLRNFSLARENLEAQITELKRLIEQLSNAKAEREVIKEPAFRIDELERELRALEKYSLPKMEVPAVSQEEQLKKRF